MLQVESERMVDSGQGDWGEHCLQRPPSFILAPPALASALPLLSSPLWVSGGPRG